MINVTINYDSAEDFEKSKKYIDNKMYYKWSNGEKCGFPYGKYIISDEHNPDCFVVDKNFKPQKKYKIGEIKEIIKKIKRKKIRQNIKYLTKTTTTSTIGMIERKQKKRKL